MNEKIIDFISQRLNISRRDLIEKDIILTNILRSLSSERNFSKNYAFKGGTCLIKCYLGYYRFSEDLDFTYLNQKDFEGKSEKQIRTLISDKIDEFALMLEKIAKPLDLRFKNEKQNREYFEFGGSNSFVTFKLWYFSKELNKDTFIKIQINHREKLRYKVKEAESRFIVPKALERDFSFLQGEEADLLTRPLKITCYDLKEVLIEKVRAILTRRGVKARDFIDVYKITKINKLKIESFEEEILDKTRSMLKFEKYKKNLNDKKEINFPLEIDKDKIKLEEERIILTPLEKDFDSFLDNFKKFIEKVIKKV